MAVAPNANAGAHALQNGATAEPEGTCSGTPSSNSGTTSGSSNAPASLKGWFHTTGKCCTRVNKYLVDPRRNSHKYILHVLICLFIPGPYFFDSLLGAFPEPISNELHLSGSQFSLLFAFSSLTGVFTGPMGPVIACLGRTKVALGAAFLCLLGAAITVLGFHVHLLYVMILGRVLFWLSLNNLLCVQTILIYSLFHGAELKVAYPLAITALRIGGSSAFFVSGPLLDKFGVEGALWIAVLAVCGSFIAALLFAFLFRGSTAARAMRSQLEGRSRATKKFSLKNIRQVPRSAYFMLAAIAALYGAIFPFEVVGIPLLQTNYHMDLDKAGYLFTVCPAISICSPLLAPLLGSNVQQGLGVTFIAFALFDFGLLALCLSWPPLPALACIGIGYAITVSSLWTTLPELLRKSLPAEIEKEVEALVCSLSFFGTAVAQFTSNLVIGVIRDNSSYFCVCVFVMVIVSIGGACVIGAACTYAPRMLEVTNHETQLATELEVTVVVNGCREEGLLNAAGHCKNTGVTGVLREDHYK